VLVGLYSLFMIYKAITDPKSCPALEVTPEEKKSLGRDIVVALLPPLFLIIAVLGSILTGIATPTQSASVGAVGAMIMAFGRGRLRLAALHHIVMSSAMITSMVFIIIFRASVCSIFFRMIGGVKQVEELLRGLPARRAGAINFVLALR